MGTVKGRAAFETEVASRLGYARDRAALLALARTDPRMFVRLVLKDERTGKRVHQAPVHDEWQSTLSRHDRVVMWAHVEAGKTAQVSVGRTLFELGTDPNQRIAIISKTARGAAKIMRSIAQYITRDEDCRAVFPALRPHQDKQMPWNSQALVVERSIISKDPSVQCCGLFGDILGSRLDRIVFDDILDYDNVRTAASRQQVVEWIRQTVLGRLTANAHVCFVGNAWHPQDAMHVFAAEPRFRGFRFPVVDADGRYSWPAVWTPARIERAQLDMGPDFPRQMLCLARDDASSRFKREWIDKGIAAGEGYRLVDRIDYLPPGYAVYTGVDLSVQQTAKNDLVVFFTILLHPDGKRQVLSVESGRWTGPEIVARLEDVCARYGGVCVVENNAAQDFILQFARAQSTATVVPFTTGRQKAHPEFGVEGLAAELAAGRWVIPSRKGRVHPEIDAWIAEMLYYSPSQHTGDRLMASWFAREGARAHERRRALTGGEDVAEQSACARSAATGAAARARTPRRRRTRSATPTRPSSVRAGATGARKAWTEEVQDGDVRRYDGGGAGAGGHAGGAGGARVPALRRVDGDEPLRQLRRGPHAARGARRPGAGHPGAGRVARGRPRVAVGARGGGARVRPSRSAMSARAVDLTGKRYGDLEARAPIVGMRERRSVVWLCYCHGCGRYCAQPAYSFGLKAMSCGCARRRASLIREAQRRRAGRLAGAALGPDVEERLWRERERVRERMRVRRQARKA